MRVYIGSITHETNAFSPLPTGFQDYHYHEVGYEDLVNSALTAGFDVVKGTCARAAPSAPTARPDYEQLRDRLLKEIDQLEGIDAVLLSLHGAQVAEGYPDCEADVVTAVRELLGDQVIIGVLLDLHASISADLLRSADLVTAIKEYPHTDYPVTATQLVELCRRLECGEISPVTAFVALPVYSLWHTPEQPSKTLVEAARALEASAEVLHVSLVHGFPWSDVADAGASVIVITDNDAETASRLAAQFANQLWDIRDSDLGHYQSMAAALDEVEELRSEERPVVIADAGDNPGAGTGSDATWLLHEILARGLNNVAMALFWDVAALQAIVRAGEGAQVKLSLGGNTGVLAGPALTGSFKILAINHQASIDAMPGYPQIEVGTLAAVKIEGVTVVVGDYREQVFGPCVFTELGIDPAAQELLVVKSAQHFYKAFAPLAGRIIYCDSPCSRTIDFQHLPFQHRRAPMWPLDDCSAADIPVPLLF